MRRLLLPVLAVLLVGGCSKLVVGELYDYDLYDLYDYYPYGDGSPLAVPDTVRAGRAFIASAATAGGRCTSRGTTDVKIQDNVATITPYDYEDMTIFGCTLELYMIFHEVTLRFRARGEAKVILRGRYNGEIVTVNRTVWVR